MDSLTVSSSMLIPSASNVEITPAMLTVLWGMAHELDRRRVPANTSDALWLEIPSRQLRNPNGKTDNHWLKTCLDRLMGVKLEGAYRGDEWGAVILAQWEIIEGGTVTRLLVPPAAIQAIRAPKTFAKIEITAAYRLKGHARRLYAALADKKHMGQPYWEYPLGELQRLFQLEGKYSKWYDFSRYVLTPALEEINDFGTVTVKATPQKIGRSVRSVRFDWKWKSIDAARVTDEENARHRSARGKTGDGSAPPLTDDDAAKVEERERWQNWQRENSGGTYGQYLDWKKAQGL
jgi:hypothetical protein